jgi:hypothetical protein
MKIGHCMALLNWDKENGDKTRNMDRSSLKSTFPEIGQSDTEFALKVRLYSCTFLIKIFFQKQFEACRL